MIEKIIERIRKSIELAEKEGENMDDVSWGMQEGILISHNDGKEILKALGYTKDENQIKQTI